MNKIYVVINYDCESMRIVGAFSTRDKAEEFYAKTGYSDYDIEEHVIDDSLSDVADQSPVGAWGNLAEIDLYSQTLVIKRVIGVERWFGRFSRVGNAGGVFCSIAQHWKSDPRFGVFIPGSETQEECLQIATNKAQEFARLVNECQMEYSEACDVLNKYASETSPASTMTISPLPPEIIDLDASWVDTSDPCQGPILRKRNEANTAWVAVVDEVAND